MSVPFATLISNCRFSASQSDRLHRTLFSGEAVSASPAASATVPSTPRADPACTVICSSLETPFPTKKDSDVDGDDNNDTPLAEEFKTPPEETATRVLSSSGISPASAASTFAVSNSDGSGNGEKVVAFEEEEVTSADLGLLGVGLGFAGLGKGELVEVLDDGKVKVREVSGGVLKRLRGIALNLGMIGSPMKKLKASGEDEDDSGGGGANPIDDYIDGCDEDNDDDDDDVECTQELDVESESYTKEEEDEEGEVCSAKRKLEFGDENDTGFGSDEHGGSSSISGFGSSDIEEDKTEQDNDVEGGALTDDEIDHDNGVEQFSADKTEKIEVIADQGEELLSMLKPILSLNGNERREHSDVALDGERGVVVSDVKEGEPTESMYPRAPIPCSNPGMRSTLEALRILAEERPYNYTAKVDLYKVAKSRGWTFPRPKW